MINVLFLCYEPMMCVFCAGHFVMVPLHFIITALSATVFC